MINSKSIKVLPIFTLIWLCNFSIFWLQCILGKLTDKQVEIFSLNEVYGCFGFLNPNIASFTFFAFGIPCCIFGSAGYVLCLLFYSPVITTNSYLLEPFMAQILGFSLGLDLLPGWLTFVGTIITLGGILML